MLLLDEATSVLDNVTQGVVARNVAYLGITRIVVAHRLSTIESADRIAVIDAGRVEQGTHATLMASSGAYANLVARQVIRDEERFVTIVRGDAPINYYGEQHTATKEFLLGTQRAMPPEETLARIRPHFATVGITRLADITGLDRLGVPIWCSIRPDSSTLAVDSGKGATPVAAATSAAMEALERSIAEVFDDVATLTPPTSRSLTRLPSGPMSTPA